MNSTATYHLDVVRMIRPRGGISCAYLIKDAAGQIVAARGRKDQAERLLKTLNAQEVGQ